MMVKAYAALHNNVKNYFALQKCYKLGRISLKIYKPRSNTVENCGVAGTPQIGPSGRLG